MPVGAAEEAFMVVWAHGCLMGMGLGWDDQGVGVSGPMVHCRANRWCTAGLRAELHAILVLTAGLCSVFLPLWAYTRALVRRYLIVPSSYALHAASRGRGG
jgi:hypothetical protein